MYGHVRGVWRELSLGGKWAGWVQTAEMSTTSLTADCWWPPTGRTCGLRCLERSNVIQQWGNSPALKNWPVPGQRRKAVCPRKPHLSGHLPGNADTASRAACRAEWWGKIWAAVRWFCGICCMSSLLTRSERLAMRDNTEEAERVSYRKDRDVPRRWLFSELDLTILYESTLEWWAQSSSL